MMVWYLTALLCTNIGSVGAGALALSKVINVSNGFSLLDPDISSGLKVRKWFLICLGLCNIARFTGTLIEIILYFRTIILDGKMYASMLANERGTIVSMIVSSSKAIPTALFITVYLFSASYFITLDSKLNQGRPFILRRILVLVMILSMAITLLCLFRLHNEMYADLNFVIVKSLLFLLVLWHVISLLRYFAGNGRASILKVINRFYIFSVLLLASLILSCSFHVWDVYNLETSR
jgi:hypothetical protein